LTDQGVELLDALREQRPDEPSLIYDLSEAYRAKGCLPGMPGSTGQASQTVWMPSLTGDLLHRIRPGLVTIQ